MAETNIIVIGAGVLGLTSTLVLSKHANFKITVVAKHMPGDYDIEYASPWAGANYLPVGEPGTELCRYERDTWAELDRLVKNVPEAGIHHQPTVLYKRAKDASSVMSQKDPWFKNTVADFRIIPSSECPAGCEYGTAFTSVCINTAIYLPWLLGQCVKNGVVFKRSILSHISDAAALHHSGTPASITINCTGLSAGKLGGVMDPTVFPGRGQIVLVRNEPGVMGGLSGTDDAADEITYVMQRAVGGGTILGGCLQKDVWESQPDPNLAVRIMKRCVEFYPELTNGKGIEALSVIRHGVGLRPMRRDGLRVEKEKIEGNWVVHCYGHAGQGYQSSYGSVAEVERLVESIVGERARL
ncbi:FAD dependent oxidoreductase [Mytilinidion resinicola]|uniref:FAD dependent oxidoreductase n=1 Tax=Mytilinidion resinicola TaxID=574789 RepID=A0A6A6Z7P0_9PEZI|nr:FAD dependent oxidoreductase [Mytilinidion resinicola]KAF2816285.1 FAD dependent oxidoreductase [Mytilinidion resinicola]